MASKVTLRNMNTLSLDPATKCGWAHSCGASGTWDLSIRRDESKGMRLIRFKGKLNEILRDAGVDLVVYEAARFKGMGGPLVVQSEIQGVLKVWCEENGIEYRAYSSKEIKAHAVGGSANKQQMIDAASKAFPVKIEDDNHADALWLLSLSMRDYK